MSVYFLIRRAIVPHVPSPLRTLWGLKEKVAEGRMRGRRCCIWQLCPLTLALSLMERGLKSTKAED
jgi:hypothetical protein